MWKVKSLSLGWGRLGGASPTSLCSLTAIAGWPRKPPSGRVSVEAALRGMRRRRNFSAVWEKQREELKVIPSSPAPQLLPFAASVGCRTLTRQCTAEAARA